ncbi:MAG TPA: hypothetical protein VFS75_01730 [Candidatus Paceibacterota bacterium]|nr:hypothetical protein [Candidatus Paceibacterota bacterium]
MFPKNSAEYKFLKKLNTPEKVQTFLEKLPFNHEKGGETCMSPKRVLQTRTAHCLEGALLACAAFMLAGRKPYIVNLKVHDSDIDHAIVLFTENGRYGAISKTNHAVLRFRDPVYRSLRELVMSYFHEYFLYGNGKKTLIGYSKPLNVRRFGTKWITAEEDLWDMGGAIFDAPITRIAPPRTRLRRAQPFERNLLKKQEWPE